MEKKELKEKIIFEINQVDTTLTGLHQIVKEFKNQNGKKDEAYKVVEEILLSTEDDEMEDVLLELMDFISGFCAPHMVIWDRL